MTQSTYAYGATANISGPAFRADHNAMATAIASQNEGTTAPSPTYAGMWWRDIGNTLLKQRNSANSAWVTIGTLDAANLGLALNSALTSHTDGADGVHGVTGSVVGTTDTQTLTNKTFDGLTAFPGASSVDANGRFSAGASGEVAQGKFHAKVGESGASAADASVTALFGEGAAEVYIQLVTAADGTCRLLMGDVSSPISTRIISGLSADPGYDKEMAFWVDNNPIVSINQTEFALRTELTHGMTDLMRENAFLTFGMIDGTGGATIAGSTSGDKALMVHGFATNEITTTDMNSYAPIYHVAMKRNGTGGQAISSDGNLFAVSNYYNTKLLVKGDGALWLNLPTKDLEISDCTDGGTGTPGEISVTIDGHSGKIPVVGGTAWTMAGYTCANLGTVTAANIRNVRDAPIVVSDDAVAVYTPTKTAGEFFIHAGGVGAHINVRVTASPVCTKRSGDSLIDVTTGVLTGTTGTDGKITVAAHTDGNIYIENRAGSSLEFAVSLICGV